MRRPAAAAGFIAARLMLCMFGAAIQTMRAVAVLEGEEHFVKQLRASYVSVV